MRLNQLFTEGSNWHTDPEQQSMDATRRGRLEREREPEGSEAIDARLAANNNARQQYAETGRFWLKQKDTQQHLNDQPYTGKAAANAAALELLKQQPELRGNLVITAYGPGEQQVTEGRVKELSQDLKDKAMSDEQFKSKYNKTRAEVRAAMREKSVAEGYRVVPDIDRERYTERPGLEGPFHTKSGKVVYYDKQEGKYYDPDSDFYISHEDWQAMNEQGVAEGSLEEINRRGFLKGMGATAASGAVGSAIAAPFKHTADKDQMTGGKTADVSTVKSNDGKATLELRRGIKPMVVLEVPGAIFNAKTYGTNCRYKIGNEPVVETILAKPSSGAYDWGAILPQFQGGEKLAEKIMSHSGEVLFEVDLYRIGAKVFKFTIEPDATTRNVKEQGVAEAGYSGIDDTDTVGFSVNSERAYNAVMARFGDHIDHDETSGILYVPARMWPQVEQVAFDADGEGAVQADGLDEGEKVGNMDADRFDAAMARLKQLAGAGPMKTVYDPAKRVYRNVPVAQQPGDKK